MTSDQNIGKIIDIIKQDDCNKLRALLGKDEYSRLLQINRALQLRHGSELFHLCAQHNASRICQFFCSYIFSNYKDAINSRDSEGKTPLHISCIMNSIECAKVLLENGAYVDALKRGDWTPLMIVTAKANLPFVQLLLEYGVDLTICNKDGWNSILLAARTGNVQLLELLAHHSAKKQLDAWAIKSKNGRTIWHIAAMNGHLSVIKYLLTDSSMTIHYPYLNCKDFCGISPFMDAIRTNCVELSRFLAFTLAKRGDFNVEQVDRSNRTALHIAAQVNACDTIKFLVHSLKCNLDCEDAWSQTPLFLAVREGHEQVTALLVELGANCKTVDFKGRNPLEIAKLFEHHQLIKYLSESK